LRQKSDWFPPFDASGQEKTSEQSHYIVQLAEDGQAYIRVALARTTKEPQ
jgi:hypothetical protein